MSERARPSAPFLVSEHARPSAPFTAYDNNLARIANALESMLGEMVSLQEEVVHPEGVARAARRSTDDA